jgi:hypothetical protein
MQCHPEVLHKVLITHGLNGVGVPPSLRKLLASNMTTDRTDAGIEIRVIVRVRDVLIHVVQADTCNSVSKSD